MCVFFPFLSSFFLPFGAESFVEKYEQPDVLLLFSERHLARFQRRREASLGSLIPRLKTPLFWSVSPAPRRGALDVEGGRGRGGTPGPGQLSSKSSTSRTQHSRCRRWLRSPCAAPRPGGGDAVRSWLRRRTRQQHVECSRSLFCLARWPALFSHSTPSPSLLSLPLL